MLTKGQARKKAQILARYPNATFRESVDGSAFYCTIDDGKRISVHEFGPRGGWTKSTHYGTNAKGEPVKWAEW